MEQTVQTVMGLKQDAENLITVDAGATVKDAVDYIEAKSAKK